MSIPHNLPKDGAGWLHVLKDHDRQRALWKSKYKSEIGSLTYERDAWRRLAMHMRKCVVLDDCEECENLWAIATKEPNGNRDEY